MILCVKHLFFFFEGVVIKTKEFGVYLSGFIQ